MTAADHLSGDQFFHGSGHEFSPGDLIHPGHESTHVMEHEHVFATTDPKWGRVYAEYNGNGARQYGGNPHLYHVEPTGSVEADSGGGNGAVKSKHPLRVVAHLDERDYERPTD